jgi:hypothetical protein
MADCRIQKFSGTHSEVGYAIGETVKGRLGTFIDDYIAAISGSDAGNLKKLGEEAIRWFENLPSGYQQELSAISRGANCPVEKVVQWNYCDQFFEGCTSFIFRDNNILWVGRNNDYLFPNIWNFINIISADDKIPVMMFGLETSIFSGTGYNKERIWLHYNWLPSWDKPPLEDRPISPYVFIRKALEECSSIDEIESALRSSIRDGGMTLFAVGGKTNEYRVFECTCRDYVLRTMDGNFIAAANHHNHFQVPDEHAYDKAGSISRQERAEELLAAETQDVCSHFVRILSDPLVEQHDEALGTVYSAIVCPHTDRLWYAADGFPSASKGGWEEIDWSW